MKSQYLWYFPPTEQEVDDMWSSALISLDTNVLLDLYRAKTESRAEILNAIRYFKKQVWLSSQVAEEFFKNRRLVMRESRGHVEWPIRLIKDLERDLVGVIEKKEDDVKKNRFLDNELLECLERTKNEITKLTSDLALEVESKTAKYPDFKESSDQVLAELFDFFDGKVGLPPQGDEAELQIKEAKHRLENKIPPGYEDNDKNENREGDCLFWLQSLQESSRAQKPLVIVTSDSKGDWWDLKGTQKLGPRRELLKEAFEKTGKRVIICSTVDFLNRYSKSKGKPITENVVEDIESIRHLDLSNAWSDTGFQKTLDTYTHILRLNERLKDLSLDKDEYYHKKTTGPFSSHGVHKEVKVAYKLPRMLDAYRKLGGAISGYSFERDFSGYCESMKDQAVSYFVTPSGIFGNITGDYTVLDVSHDESGGNATFLLIINVQFSITSRKERVNTVTRTISGYGFFNGERWIFGENSVVDNDED